MRPSLVLLLLPALTLLGQTSSGTISGKVTDPDGVAVANAQVQAKSEAGREFETKTSASGSYTLTGVPAGTYEISINLLGLRPFQKKDVVVAPGAALRVDASLRDHDSLGALGEDRRFIVDTFGPHEAPVGPVPRTPDGKPDFSGVWRPLQAVEPGKPDPLPWAESLSEERVANNLKDAPSSRCLPYGITSAGRGFGFRIMQNATVLAFLYEEELPRQIYLDGRKHPEESLSPFIGHSVGKWEGDTLVVDTVGFNDKTWLDFLGHPHTEKLRLTERFQRPDLGHLNVETTIDDPGAYKSPWTIKETSQLNNASEEVGQYVCTENNRDVGHLVGK